MKSRKDQIKVTLYTSQHRIEGILHLVENSRLSDILNTENLSRDFLPITKAIMTDLRNNKITEADFLSVNKNHIELVMESKQ